MSAITALPVSPPMNSTLPETAGYYSSSGMSELDNLSDSDWLDIASDNNSEDQDNDSLSDESENEGEPLSLPLSRTSSSISIGSSRGEVEAWEGFVDPNHGEGAGLMAPGMYPPPLVEAAGAEQTPLEFIPDIITDQDVAEDELVKEALDQSLVGTLNASRTSATSSGHASSNQASVRDLRLSFPDPLSSPRSELERSYEQVTVEQRDEARVEGAGDVATPGDLDGTRAPAPLAPADHEVTKPDFQIHLYGASTKCKWTVVQDFLQKVADGSGQFLINTLDPTVEKKLVRTAVLGKVNADSKPLFNVVRVYDRTHDDNLPDVEVNNPIDSPSLGIVFLPANRLPVLGTHNAYLAVSAKDYISDAIYNNEKALRNAAEDDLELLNIPVPQLLTLKTPSGSPVVGHQDIKYLNSRQVYRALQSIIYDDDESDTPTFKGQATPANAAKVIAVVSVLLSIAFNASSFRSPAPTPTVNMVVPNNTWTSLASIPNKSITVHSTMRGKTQVAVSSTGNSAVSIYNPGTTDLSLTPTPETKALSPSAPPVSPVMPERKAIKQARSDQTTKEKKQVALIAPAPAPEVSTTSSIPNVEPQAPEQPRAEKYDAGAAGSESSNAAMGMNFVNSLSEVLGVATETIVKAVNEDGIELMESLDDLMSVIRTQTDDLIRQSKGKARALQDQVQAVGEAFNYRNDRAKTRARQLKRRGEEFWSTAGERLKDRTQLARARARRVREAVEDGHAWDYYTARREWGDHVSKEKGRRKSCFKNRGARGRRQDSDMDSSYSDCT